jgi:hypothetical protein
MVFSLPLIFTEVQSEDAGVKSSGRKYKRCLAGVVCVLAIAPACNRLGAANGAAGDTSRNSPNLPFHSDPNAEPSAADNPRPGLPSETQEVSVPFRFHARVLPAGTLLTVRLEHALNGSKVRAGDPFSAVVAEPVTVDGDTLVGAGAAVTGAVECAVASSEPRSEGYVRLILSTITIEGKQLPLRTSSLFAHGTEQASGLNPGRDTASPRLPQGRRLTFRLTAPASLDGQSAIAYGPYPAVNTN